MSDFYFLRPLYLLLFIPFLLLLLALWKKKLSGGAWSKLCAKHLLPYVLLRKPTSQFWPLSLAALTGILCITALAGPTWERIPLPLQQKNSGLVIALDLSLAMNTEDVKPSRLQRARYKIDDILHKRQEGQTALIVYTDEAFVVTPLTTDTKTISALIPALETTIMPTHGLRHDKAIEKGAALLKQAGIANGSILLITTESQESDFDPSIPVSILGVGTEQGAPISKSDGGFHVDASGGMVLSKLNKKQLTKLAQATGGRFATLSSDDSDIDYLLAGLNQSSAYEKQEALTTVKELDGGYWLVLLALPLAALLIGRTGFLTLSLILLTTNLQAFEWHDLWFTADQQGKQAFEQKDYSQAAGKFENPNWQAAAYYNAENYAEAAKRYENDHSPDGYYNYGNALANQGAIKEAIAAYDQALALQPDHEDAAYNKKILEEMKQPPQDNEQQNQDKQQDDSQDKQDGGEQNQQDKQDDSQGDQQDKQSKDQQNDKQDKQDKQQNDKKEQQPQNDQEGSKEKPPAPELNQEAKEQYNKEMEKEIEKEMAKLDQLERDDQAAKNEQQVELDENWLQRVPDHPETLLKRKFLHQYRNQQARP